MGGGSESGEVRCSPSLISLESLPRAWLLRGHHPQTALAQRKDSVFSTSSQRLCSLEKPVASKVSRLSRRRRWQPQRQRSRARCMRGEAWGWTSCSLQRMQRREQRWLWTSLVSRALSPLRRCTSTSACWCSVHSARPRKTAPCIDPPPFSDPPFSAGGMSFFRESQSDPNGPLLPLCRKR